MAINWKHGDSIPDILRKILDALLVGFGVDDDGTAAEVVVSDGLRVGGYSAVVKSAPAVATAAYSAGDSVGGLQSLALAREAGLGVVLQSVSIVDTGFQKAAFTLIFFDADPAASTTSDADAFDLHDDDAAKVIGLVEVVADDYVDVTADEAVATKSGLGIVLQPAAGTTIYCVAVTSGTPDYVAATDLKFQFGVLRD